MIVKRHIGLPENEIGIIESEDMLIHNIVTSELKEKDKQITQLTNNWSELEEWVIKESEKTILAVGHMTALCMVLNKMKEIKEKNND